MNSQHLLARFLISVNMYSFSEEVDFHSTLKKCMTPKSQSPTPISALRFPGSAPLPSEGPAGTDNWGSWATCTPSLTSASLPLDQAARLEGHQHLSLCWHHDGEGLGPGYVFSPQGPGGQDGLQFPGTGPAWCRFYSPGRESQLHPGHWSTRGCLSAAQQRLPQREARETSGWGRPKSYSQLRILRPLTQAPGDMSNGPQICRNKKKGHFHLSS